MQINEHENQMIEASFKSFTRGNTLSQQLNRPQVHQIILTPNQVEEIQRKAFEAGLNFGRTL